MIKILINNQLKCLPATFFLDFYFREVLKARRANPPNPPPVDALQLCMDAAGTDGKLSEDEIVAHEFIFILAG